MRPHGNKIPKRSAPVLGRSNVRQRRESGKSQAPEPAEVAAAEPRSAGALLHNRAKLRATVANAPASYSARTCPRSRRRRYQIVLLLILVLDCQCLISS